MMGKKRPSRRLNAGRATSDISVLEGDASSGSESETSVIQERISTDTFPLREDENPTQDDLHGPPYLEPINMTPRPLADDCNARASGDDSCSISTQITKMSSALNTFIDQVDHHNSTIKECMGSMAGMIKDNNTATTRLMTESMKSTGEMVKECMMGVANIIKDNNLQMQSNFQMVMKGIVNLSERVERESGGSPITASSQTTSTTHSSSHDLTQNTSSEGCSISSVIGSRPQTASIATPTRTHTLAPPQDPVMTTTSSIQQFRSTPSMSEQATTPTILTSNSSLQTLTSIPSKETLTSSTSYDSKPGHVKLPAFTGNSNDNWKVWFSRFTTVASLNRWNDTRCLSELVQRLQGTAAEFVFDEIGPESLADYRSLIIELDSRFKSVETHKTYRAQFAKRIQYFNESIEEYAAELKRLYDKSYPGKNSEMRRQLLLQQFMNGLKDKKAKFAVEYYKEPTSIEDAVHHVVTYMETQQGPHFENGNSTRRSKKNVRFHDTGYYADADISSDDETYMPHRPYSPGQRDRQTVRKIQNSTPRHANKKRSDPVADSAPQPSEPLETKQLLDKILTMVETACTSTQPTSSDSPRGQHSTGSGRYSDVRCYFCSNIGHFKRECPLLQNSQQMQPNRSPRQSRVHPADGLQSHRQQMYRSTGPSERRQNNEIDLN